MSVIGHNGGPAMDAGASWRRHCWQKARAQLLPSLPVEIVRNRVRRARELGLEYRTYATVRELTGRDVVALLFSSNALDMHRRVADLPEARREKLRGLVRCSTLLAAQPPLEPLSAAAEADRRHGVAFACAFRAPGLADGWSATAARLSGALATASLHREAVMVIGTTALEREWCAAGRMAGYLPAERYFA